MWKREEGRKDWKAFSALSVDNQPSSPNSHSGTKKLKVCKRHASTRYEYLTLRKSSSSINQMLYITNVFTSKSNFLLIIFYLKYFIYHINDLSIKLNRTNVLLFKMRKYVSLEILRSIYFAVSDSYLSYCSLAWD